MARIGQRLRKDMLNAKPERCVAFIKNKAVCQYCGKIYFIETSQLNRTKFCSDKCFRASRNKQHEYCCDYCGKKFLVTQSKIDAVANGKATGLFCSKQCAKDFQKPKWSDIVDLFENYNYTLISTSYINAKTPLEYVCNKHSSNGSQFVRYDNLKHGFGCKFCGREKQADKRRNSFEKVRELFAKHDMELLEQEYVNSSTPLKYICKYHPERGVQYMTASNARVQHCPYCNVSKGEDRIRSFLVDNNIDFESQKKFNDLGCDLRHRLSYDFFVPSVNLLIEYQGEQHEHPVDLFGGQEQFEKQVSNDNQKREYAMTHGFDLLEIWYYEYDRIEELLTNSIILTKTA